jgi:hypothetical protein
MHGASNRKAANRTKDLRNTMSLRLAIVGACVVTLFLLFFFLVPIIRDTPSCISGATGYGSLSYSIFHAGMSYNMLG